MFDTLRSRMLALLFGTILLTTITLTAFVQVETETQIITSQDRHTRNLLETLRLNVANEYESYLFYKQALLEERKSELENITGLALKQVEGLYEESRQGELSEKEAQRQAIAIVRRMHYADDLGYLWIQNTEQPLPRLLMHGRQPRLEGKSAGDDPLFYQALDGKDNLFSAFTRLCLTQGEGFVDYRWPKPTPTGMGDMQPKTAHLRFFQPWGWIIGTGLYMDDIEADSKQRLDAILQELRHTLKQVSLGDTGHVFLFNGRGELLIAPGLEELDLHARNHANGLSLLHLLKLTAQSQEPLRHADWTMNSFDKAGPIRTYVVYFEPLDWYIAASVNEKELSAPALVLRSKVLMIALFFMLLAIFLAWGLAANLARPLVRLASAARQIESAGGAGLIPVGGTRETQVLGSCLNDMLESLSQSVEEKEKLLQELRESEEKLRTTLNSIGDGVIATDLNGCILRMNPVAEQLTGWREIECQGRPLAKVFHVMHATSRQPILNPVERVLAEGKIVGLANHTALLARDGTEYQIADSAAPIRDDQGAITGVVLVFRDVSEEYRVREALRETQELQRDVFSNTPSVIYIKDLEGRYLFVNRKYEELFQVNNEALRGKTARELFPSEQAELFHANDLKVAEVGINLQFEETLHREDGDHIYISMKFPLRRTTGETFAVCGVSTDITERKQQENELRQLRNYLSNIIDSMPSTLIGVDREGNITQWNRAAQQVSGIAANSAMGRPLVQVYPKLASEMERIREAILSRREQTDHRRAYWDDGNIRYEDVTIYPLIANGVEGAVIRIDDVTDRLRIEEMMIQTEKMLSVGGLAAGMAHEINNPLGGIMQTSEVMIRRLTGDLPANEQAAEAAGVSIQVIQNYMQSRNIPRMLDTIRDSCRRAAEIVRDMLDFARLGDDNLTFCNLAELLDQTVHLSSIDYDLKKRYDFKQIEIVREYADDLPAIQCAPQKLQQVLLNILKNGAQAMQEKTQQAAREGEAQPPRFVLRLAQEPATKMVRIEIADNGPGMDEATRKRVFEPFFTTKPAGIGTGLGLSVSYFIVTESLGGSLSVESELGVGTTFVIRLPLS